jgi:hypothetical protein
MAITGFIYSMGLWLLGLTCSFTGLFTIGYFLMLKPMLGVINLVVALVSFYFLTQMIEKEE